MKRFLIVVVLFSAAILILRRLAGLFQGNVPHAVRGSGGRSRSAGSRRGVATELVRDRTCNTYLPKDRALKLEEPDQVHYFCSEQCRSRHKAGASREMGVAQRA